MAASDAGPQRVRWARLLGALLLLAALGEVACRVAIRHTVGRPFESFDAYAFSGYGVYRQNARYTHPQFVHNAAGFRNTREFSVDRPDGVFRVMAIGASVLYSGSAITHLGASRRIHTDETITAYLEPLLEELPALRGRDVEVINASVNRFDLRNTTAYYVGDLGRYRPDLVLVFGTHNDAASLGYVGGFDQLFFDPDEPTPEERRLEQLANGASLGALAEKWVRVAVNRSALAATGYRVLDRVLQRASVAMRSAPAGGTPPARAREIAPPEVIDEAVRTYLAGLDALVTFIEVSGAVPVVFWEYQLLTLEGIKPLSPYERDLVDFFRRQNLAFRPEEIAVQLDVKRRVADYLERRGVRMIDILEPVSRYSGNLFNDYLHYDAEGNRWVAGVVAEAITPLVRSRLDSAPRR